MPRRARLLSLAALYPAWLLFEVVHESGHVLHAWVSGGTVERLELPLAGFSRTVLSLNPHPLFVAVGGPLWGALLPLAIVSAVPRRWAAARRAASAFAGLCCVGNGTYVAVGWTQSAGDAADLVRLGTPVATLVLAGSAAVAAGLWLWHGVGQE